MSFNLLFNLRLPLISCFVFFVTPSITYFSSLLLLLHEVTSASVINKTASNLITFIQLIVFRKVSILFI